VVSEAKRPLPVHFLCCDTVTVSKLKIETARVPFATGTFYCGIQYGYLSVPYNSDTISINTNSTKQPFPTANGNKWCPFGCINAAGINSVTVSFILYSCVGIFNWHYFRFQQGEFIRISTFPTGGSWVLGLGSWGRH
jgi:hypothetical protein